MLNLLIPITGALLVTTRRPALKLVAALTMLLSVATVVITFSRAGFIALITIVLLGFVALVRRRLPGAAIAIVLAALVVPPMLPPGYLDRLNTITDIDKDRTGSAQGRWEDFGAAVDVVIKNPLTGVGLGQDILALNEERGATWRSVHNVYLQYAVDLGLPGAALFLWLLVALFRGATRVRQRAAREPSSAGPRRARRRRADRARGLCRRLVLSPGRLPVLFLLHWRPRGRAAEHLPTSRSSAWRGRMNTQRPIRSEDRADAAVRRHREPVHDARAIAASAGLQRRTRMPPTAGARSSRRSAIAAFRSPSTAFRASTACGARAAGEVRAPHGEAAHRHVHAYSFYGNVFGILPARLAATPVVIASIRDRGAYLTPMQKRVQRLCLPVGRLRAGQRRRRQGLADRAKGTTRRRSS